MTCCADTTNPDPSMTREHDGALPSIFTTDLPAVRIAWVLGNPGFRRRDVDRLAHPERPENVG